MRDEYFDRDYQAARQVMNDGIARLIASAVASAMAGFRALNAIQFETPWEASCRA